MGLGEIEKTPEHSKRTLLRDNWSFKEKGIVDGFAALHRGEDMQAFETGTILSFNISERFQEYNLPPNLDLLLQASTLVWNPTEFSVGLIEKVITEIYAKEDNRERFVGGTFLDLGSATFFLGGVLQLLFNPKLITFSDINYQALISTKVNWHLNFLGSETECKVIESDCFSNINKEDKYDIIITNPPTAIESPVLKTKAHHWNQNGPFGRSFTDEVLTKARSFLHPNGFLIMATTYKQNSPLTIEMLNKEFGVNWTCTEKLIPLAAWYKSDINKYRDNAVRWGMDPDSMFPVIDGVVYQRVIFIIAKNVSLAA